MYLIESLLIVAAIALLAMPVVAIVAIVIAQRANRELVGMRARIDQLEWLMRARYRDDEPEAGAAAPKGVAPEETIPEKPPSQDVPSPDVPSQEPPSEEPHPEEPRADEPRAAESGPSPETPVQDIPVDPPPAQSANAPVPAIRDPMRAKASLEERLGARWAVWIGAVALALGGAFLVRFSLEQGLLGPGARIGLAALFALALLIAGEVLRRRDYARALPGLGPGHVPSALTAAGAVSAFATVYAAFALYAFLGPATAFLLLGALGLLTLLAALLHGPLLAGLGLIGAFAVPLLTGGEAGQTWPLVPYFLVVTAAAHALAWLRGWRRLALAATALALFWTVPMLEGEPLPARVHLIMQTALAVFVFAILPYRGIPVSQQSPDPGARGVFVGILALFVMAMSFLPDDTAALYFAGLMIALMLIAGATPALSAAAITAIGAVIVTLYLWPVAREALDEPTRILPGPAGDLPWPEAFRSFVVFAVVTTLAAAALGFWRLREAAVLPRRIAADYAVLFAAAPAFVLIVVYWRLTGAARLMEGVAEPAFAVAAALLAGAYTLIATRLRGVGGTHGNAAGMGPAAALVCSLCAVAALGNLSLALAFWLDRGMLTVAFALTGAGAAFVSNRTGITMLRYGVGALAVIVALRLLWDPGIVHGDPGRGLVFNWLLWGYGVPAASFLAAAHWLSRDGRDAMARLCEALGIVLAVLLVFFQLRHALYGGMPPVRFGALLDAALAVLTALSATMVLLHVDARRPDPVTRIGARLFGLIALAISAAGLFVMVNPLFTNAPVPGGRYLNALLSAYLLPAILAGAIAVMLRRAAREAEERARAAPGIGVGHPVAGLRRTRFSHGLSLTMAVLAFLLQALWSVAAIRMAFQGPRIGLMRVTGETELWTYSAMLLVLGLTALVIGLWRQLPWLRLIAAGYLAAAVAKVFFVDLSGLGGPIRAASFIALGLVLVGVGLLYQRLLRRTPARKP